MFIQPGRAAWAKADRAEGVPGLGAEHLPNVPQKRKFQARAHLLSVDEECRLFSAWRDNGDLSARDKIIIAHSPLIQGIACKRRSASKNSTVEIPIEDLLGEGALALCKAITRFNPDASNRFGAYARKWIEGAIGRYIREHQSVVRGGAFDSQIDPEPDNEGVQYADDSPSPEEIYAGERKLQAVNDAVSRLSSRERRILGARRLTDKPITLKNLSIELGVSIERVRQIEASAFEKVRQDVRQRLGFPQLEGKQR